MLSDVPVLIAEQRQVESWKYDIQRNHQYTCRLCGVFSYICVFSEDNHCIANINLNSLMQFFPNTHISSSYSNHVLSHCATLDVVDMEYRAYKMLSRRAARLLNVCFVNGENTPVKGMLSGINPWNSEINLLRPEKHDDVIKWKHFCCCWPFVRGIHRLLPAQRPVTRSFGVFFDLRLNKRLSKQWWDWRF